MFYDGNPLALQGRARNPPGNRVRWSHYFAFEVLLLMMIALRSHALALRKYRFNCAWDDLYSSG